MINFVSKHVIDFVYVLTDYVIPTFSFTHVKDFVHHFDRWIFHEIEASKVGWNKPETSIQA